MLNGRKNLRLKRSLPDHQGYEKESHNIDISIANTRKAPLHRDTLKKKKVRTGSFFFYKREET